MGYGQGLGIRKSVVGASGTSFILQTIRTHFCSFYTARQFVA